MGASAQGIHLTVRMAVRCRPSLSLSNAMLLIGRPNILRVFHYVAK